MSDHNPNDIASLEQRTRLFTDLMAPLLWGFFVELKDRGFDPAQAFQLTRDYFQCLLMMRKE